MMLRSAIFLVLAGALGAGCAEAPAQQPVPRWEHGLLDFIHFRDEGEQRDKYSWATAQGEVEAANVSEFWSALEIKGDLANSRADLARVLDFLAGAGWQLINRSDVAFVYPGGTAVGERYVLRRKR
ncbi:MAG: hypothetical protein ACYTEZ_15380 [Planctomycetota bacterium]|jgi:hypothetical protein